MAEAAITCPICKNTLRDPVQLSCFHTFCRSCILDNNPEDISGPYVCSVCHVETQLSKQSVRTTANDAFLTRYTQIVKTILLMEDKCNNCAKEVFYFCLECLISLCESCNKTHIIHNGHIVKHETSDVNTVLEDMFARQRKLIYRCRLHNEEMLFFCMTCLKLACMQCTFEEHKKHWCVSISEGLKLKAEDIKSTSDTLRLYHRTIKKNSETIPKFYANHFASLKKEAFQYFKNMKSLIHQKEVNTIEEIEEIERSISSFSNAYIESSTSIASQSQAATDRLKMLNRYGSESDMLEHFRAIKESYTWQHVTMPTTLSLSQVSLEHDVSDELIALLDKIKLKSTPIKGHRINFLLKNFRSRTIVSKTNQQ